MTVEIPFEKGDSIDGDGRILKVKALVMLALLEKWTQLF